MRWPGLEAPGALCGGRARAVRADATKYDGLTGLDFCAGEEELGLQIGKHLLDQIVASCMETPPVMISRSDRKSFFDVSWRSRRGSSGAIGNRTGIAAGLPHLHGKRIDVGVADLCGAGFGIDSDDLIAGGKNRHARANKDVHYFAFADGGCQCDGGFVEASACVDQKASAFGLGTPLGDDVFAGRAAFCDFDRMAPESGVFHQYDGVRALRNRRPGHDRECFAAMQNARVLAGLGTCFDLSDYLQLGWKPRQIGPRALRSHRALTA